jgi:hypothetical protein
MPKGKKFRPKQMDQPTTCEFKKIELEFVFRPKSSHCKIWSLMGRILIMGKGGSFGT